MPECPWVRACVMESTEHDKMARRTRACRCAEGKRSRFEWVALSLHFLVSSKMIRLTESDVRRLDPPRVIAAIEDAFRDRYSSTAIPIRTQIVVAGGVLLMMPCYDRFRPAFGMKILKVQSDPDCRENRVQATYLLLDPETGAPTATISANYLTDLRTAATSAVATKWLARDDVQTLGIFGTGSEARSHLRILPMVRNFERALICGRTMDRSREFIEATAGELAIPVESADPQTCAAESARHHASNGRACVINRSR